MSKFAIGEKVDNAADDHEAVPSSPCSRRWKAISDTRWTWKATARFSSSPKKN
jgi:hypothetical protein